MRNRAFADAHAACDLAARKTLDAAQDHCFACAQRQTVERCLQAAQIVEGEVHLSITSAQAESLGEYEEPATSAEIEADSKGGIGEAIAADVREVEAKAFAPIETHEHEMNVWRRIAFFFRRLWR